MGRVNQRICSSPELSFTPLDEKPTQGILKGGAYGSQEKGQKESQEKRKINSFF
jgi:hypothetical protein